MKLFQSCGQDHNNNLGKEKQKGDVRVVVREDNKDKEIAAGSEPPKKKQRLTTDPIDPKQQQQGYPIDPEQQQQPTDPIDPICK